MDYGKTVNHHPRVAAYSLTWVPVFIIGLLGCGSASFAGNVFEDSTTRYRLGEPGHGFAQVAIGDNDVTYSHPDLGTIGVNATCEGYDDVPVQALTNHLLFGTAERELLEQNTVRLDGRGALHSRYRLSLDGVPVKLELYVLAKNGCIFDFSHVAGTAAPREGTVAFTRLVEGFSMLSE